MDPTPVTTLILQSLPAGVVVSKRSGGVLSVNAAAATLLGVSEAQLLGEEPFPRGWSLLGSDGVAFQAGGIDPKVDHIAGPFGVRLPDGTERWLHGDTSVFAAGDAPPDDLLVTMLTEATDSQSELDAAQRRLAEVVGSIPVGLFATDPTGHCTYVNDRWVEIFGLSKAAARGHGWADGIHPEDRDTVYDEWAAASARGDQFRMTFRTRHADGTVRDVRAVSRPIIEDGEIVGHSGSVEDITEQREASARATRATERYQALFDSAPVGMLELASDGRIRRANPAIGSILGVEVGALPGQPAAPTLGFSALEDLLRAGQGQGGSDDTFGAHAVPTSSGEPQFLMIQTAPLATDEGDPSWLIQVADVTEGARLEQQLRYLADHDPVTGVMNRRSFTEALEEFVAGPDRRDGRGALLLIDLDNFKSINDTLGHAEGDRVIAAVADVIQRRLRESDHVARLGGDEFAVFARDCNLEGATRLADDLVTAIRHQVSAGAAGGTQRPVTASIGATMWRRSHRNVDAFVADADKALYEAKDAGRDTSVVLGKLAPALFRSPLSWIERIEAALTDDRFELHSQPIVELEHGTIVCDELLLRMIDEDGNRIAPGAWIMAAERAGIFTRLDPWVIESAIPLAARHHVPVSINLSGRSVRGTALLELIERTVAAEGIDPGLLTFEVTETSAITNMTEAQRFLRSLRAMGCLAALDDFGKGFGSFQYLKHLPFDIVKIDGEFVRECDTDRTDRAVIRSVVEICRDVGAVVVAEQVETASVLDTVVSLGVQRAQGYLLGTPTAAETAFSARRDPAPAR